MTARQWLRDKAAMWIRYNPGPLTDEHIWEVIEGRARNAQAMKLSGDSRIWTYYMGMSEQSAKRLITEVRQNVENWNRMIDKARDRSLKNGNK